MCSGMSFQIKCVVESFAAECAQVTLGVTVTFHVSVQQSLQGEDLGALPALKFGWVRLWPDWGQLLNWNLLIGIGGHGILDAMSSIDQLNGSICRNSKL